MSTTISLQTLSSRYKNVLLTGAYTQAQSHTTGARLTPLTPTTTSRVELEDDKAKIKDEGTEVQLKIHVKHPPNPIKN